jgi:actin-like ATPase involved in cell morphogenesis
MNEQVDGQKLQELLKNKKLYKSDEELMNGYIQNLFLTPEGRSLLVSITAPEGKNKLQKVLCETIVNHTRKKWDTEILDEDLGAYIEILKGVVAGQPTNSPSKWNAIQLIYAKRQRPALALFQSTLESISPKTEVTKKYENYAKPYMGLDCGLELLKGLQEKDFNPGWLIPLVRQVKIWSDEKKAIVEKRGNRTVQGHKSDTAPLQHTQPENHSTSETSDNVLHQPPQSTKPLQQTQSVNPPASEAPRNRPRQPPQSTKPFQQTQSVNPPASEAPRNRPRQPSRSTNRPIPPRNDATVKLDSAGALLNFVTFFESGISEFKKVIQQNKELTEDLKDERRFNQEHVKDGDTVAPLKVVEDFFFYLKEVVRSSELQERELTKAAITVPVQFPYQSRENLCRACENVGIEITHIYQEPVAALYCHTLSNRNAADVAAVFDWGGGTLDVATVKIKDGLAQIQRQDGAKVGGDDFDRILALQALTQFKRDYPETHLSPEEVLEHALYAHSILREAERVKRVLSDQSEEDFIKEDLLAGRHVEFEVQREVFEEWIEPEIERAISLMKRTIKDTGIPLNLVNPVLLSGGTCNIPMIRERLQQEFGPDVIVTELAFNWRKGGDRPPETDVSNATAIGAALLAVFGSEPVFSHDVGIRTGDGEGDTDGFYSIFSKGTQLKVGEPIKEQFFVSNTNTGVARILICDQLDQDMHPQGYLKRILPIAIDYQETWVDVEFELTQHLGLRISGSGRIARSKKEATATFIQELNLAFKIPEHSSEIFNF